MDPEEVAKRVCSLKISTSSDDNPLIIPADLASFGQQRLESCLVAKIFSSKAVNRETFRVHMLRILQANKSVKIEVVGENLFLLDFSSNIDRRHALMDGPGRFFKDLVVFIAPKELQQTSNLNFDEIPIWVQCHNLPLSFMHESLIRNIGARIGRVVEVDSGEDGSFAGKFARIRVILDITKPLKQGIWVRPEHLMEDICVILLYEILPQLCYLCGCLGHVLRDCVDNKVAATELRLVVGFVLIVEEARGGHRLRYIIALFTDLRNGN